MVPDCKAPKVGVSVTLACLVTGFSSATWQTGTEKVLAKDFVIRNFQQRVTYLFYQTIVWTPDSHGCSAQHTSKTFQWPASWETLKDEAELAPLVTHGLNFSEKLTPGPTTARDPAPGDTFTRKDTHSPEAARGRGTTGLLPAASTAPSSLAVRALATPGAHAAAGAASWLLCDVAGFSPPKLLLTWQEGPRQVDASWFATAAPTAEPGDSTFRTWSVLRVPAVPGSPPATYTCQVRHPASGRRLNASWSLGTAGPAPPLWGPLSMDQDCDGSAALDDALEAAGRLWPTFVALFLLTLLYSCFVTFIKVKGRDPAPLGCAKKMPFQRAHWSRPGTVRSWETPAGGQWAVGTRLA